MSDTFSMWDGPADEITDQRTATMQSLAVAAVEPLWGFLREATSDGEFEQRLGISEGSIDLKVAQVVGEDAQKYREQAVLALRERFTDLQRVRATAAAAEAVSVGLKVADYANPTPMCNAVSQLQGEAYTSLGLRGIGSDEERAKVIDFIKAKIKEKGLTFTQADLDCMEDCNAHAGYEAAEQTMGKTSSKTAAGPITWSKANHMLVDFLRGKATNGDNYAVYHNPNMNPKPCTWVNYGSKYDDDTAPLNGDFERGQQFVTVMEAMKDAERNAAGAKTSAKAPEGVSQEHWDAAGEDAGLGKGHIWTNTQCPAYRSLDPKDCTCKSKTSARDTGNCGTCGRATSYDHDARKWSHDNPGSDTNHPVTKSAAFGYDSTEEPCCMAYVTSGGQDHEPGCPVGDRLPDPGHSMKPKSASDSIGVGDRVYRSGGKSPLVYTVLSVSDGKARCEDSGGTKATIDLDRLTKVKSKTAQMTCKKCGSPNVILTIQPGFPGSGPGGSWRMGDPGGTDVIQCRNCFTTTPLKPKASAVARLLGSYTESDDMRERGFDNGKRDREQGNDPQGVGFGDPANPTPYEDGYWAGYHAGGKTAVDTRHLKAGPRECEHAGDHHSDDVQSIYHGTTEPTYLCGFHLQQVDDLSNFPHKNGSKQATEDLNAKEQGFHDGYYDGDRDGRGGFNLQNNPRASDPDYAAGYYAGFDAAVYAEDNMLPVMGSAVAALLRTAANPNFSTPEGCLCPPPRDNDPRGDRRNQKHWEIRDDHAYYAGPFDRRDGGPGSAGYAMMQAGEWVGFGSTPDGPGLHLVEVDPGNDGRQTANNWDSLMEQYRPARPATTRVVSSTPDLLCEGCGKGVQRNEAHLRGTAMADKPQAWCRTCAYSKGWVPHTGASYDSGMPEGFKPVRWHVYRQTLAGQGVPVEVPNEILSREQGQVLIMGLKEREKIRTGRQPAVHYLVAEDANGVKVPDYGDQWQAPYMGSKSAVQALLEAEAAFFHGPQRPNQPAPEMSEDIGRIRDNRTERRTERDAEQASDSRRDAYWAANPEEHARHLQQNAARRTAHEGGPCYNCTPVGSGKSYHGGPCSDCRGTGVDTTPYGTGGDHCPFCGNDWKQPHDGGCPRLGARRQIHHAGVPASEMTANEMRCDSCDGGGVAWDMTCQKCGGYGVIDKSQKSRYTPGGRHAVNESGYGSDRYQKTPYPPKPEWIHDPWFDADIVGHDAIPLNSRDMENAFSKETLERVEQQRKAARTAAEIMPPGSVRITPSTSMGGYKVVQVWGPTSAETLGDHLEYEAAKVVAEVGIEVAKSGEWRVDCKDAKIYDHSKTSARRQADLVEEADPLEGLTQKDDFEPEQASQPLTTRPRVVPTEHQRPIDQPMTPEGVPPGMDSSVPDVDLSGFATPTYAQRAQAKRASIARRVLADNPTLGRAAALSIADQTLRAYPEMLRNA